MADDDSVQILTHDFTLGFTLGSNTHPKSSLLVVAVVDVVVVVSTFVCHHGPMCHQICSIQTTEVKDSSISSLPGLAFVDTLAFPTVDVFDRIKAGENTATIIAKVNVTMPSHYYLQSHRS